MRVRRPGWRWVVVAGLTGSLCGLPSLLAALPVSGPDVAADELLERVRRSDAVAWSGYGEVRGDLVLPDVKELADLPQLISGTTRLRAWWAGPEQHRVDALSLVGETGVVVDGPLTWTWDSADRTAQLQRSVAQARLPRGADLLAPALGARLSRSDAVVAEPLSARRVAGRDASGLRLRPVSAGTTTVEHVDLWVEPSTGLALRVEVHARGIEGAALTSTLLDLDLSAPRPKRTRFRPPPGARVEVVEAPDLAAAADRFAPFRLPDDLAGLPRRPRAGDLGEGVGTYGEGLTALTVVPLEERAAHDLLRSLQDQDGGTGGTATFSTALLQGLVAHSRDRAYLLAGTVPQDVLRQALFELRADPPPRRRR